jgi:hypothetical protein
VAGHAAGDFPLVFATLAHLERLAQFPTLEALWAHADAKPVVTVMPFADLGKEPPEFILAPEVRECW